MEGFPPLEEGEGIILREQLVELIRDALKQLGGPGDRESLEAVPVLFSIPKNEQYGDYATNVAMGLAKILKRPPLQIAEELVLKIPSGLTWLDRVEVAKPGFINFFLKDQAFQGILPLIIRAGASFGQATWGMGQKIQVEFVSANPTGPLHIGHGRGAALGGALANLLRATGHTVETEYYLNDVGTQMETLGRSIQTRARELSGEPVEFPENGYQGEYIKEIAREIIREEKEWTQADLTFFSQQGREKILAGIKEDLDTFGIPFDCWFSEESLYTQGLVDDLMDVRGLDLDLGHAGEVGELVDQGLDCPGLLDDRPGAFLDHRLVARLALLEVLDDPFCG